MTTWAAMFQSQVGDNVPAVLLDGRIIRSSDLAELAAGAADWTSSLGVSDPSVLPALLTTTAEAVALAVAGATSGTPLAPLNPRLTARELAVIIELLPGSVIIAEESFADLARDVGTRTGRRVAVVPELTPSARGLHFDRPGDATAMILHTSGTTGIPRSVAISQRKLALRSHLQGGIMGLGPGTSYTSFSPLPHIAGLGTLLVALALGAAAIPTRPFSVDVWRDAARYRPTHAMLVPTMIDILLAADALQLESLRVLLYGSSSISPSTLRRAMEVMPDVELLNMYGQTEGGPFTFLDGADHRRALDGHPELLLSVGRPIPCVELRIEEAGPGGVGQVCARADHLFKADPDGWLRTGDLGSLHDNYLFLSGRKGDIIIRGGENIYPVEVDMVLAEHPQVAEAAVVGVPDHRLGQTVKAFLVARDPDDPPDLVELRAFARERLAGFKVPTMWAFVDALPRNAIGKVLRRELPTEPAESDAQRSREPLRP